MDLRLIIAGTFDWKQLESLNYSVKLPRYQLVKEKKKKKLFFVYIRTKFLLPPFVFFENENDSRFNFAHFG